MELQQETKGSITVVKPAEQRLDSRSAADFKQQMTGLIQAGREWIVLDLSGVNFIDSSGLGAIVSSLKLLGERGDIVIAGARNTIATMFKLTRMDKVFRMFAGCDEALAALAR